jgi:heme exporter protein A
MLTCFNLTSVRGYKRLFCGLGFSIFPGSIIIVEGQNGSGKSTLLRMIAGLMSPDSGEIRLEDYPIKDHPSYPRVLQYVGHKNALFPELTVRENLMHYAYIKGETILVPLALAHFKLEPYANMVTSKLSAGWQRKTALARLLLSQSPLWILDEPFTSLDASGCELLSAAIKTRAQQGGMVIIASHTRFDKNNNIYININDFN